MLGGLHGRPWRMSATDAAAEIRDFASAPGFQSTLRETTGSRVASGLSSIRVPARICFGMRDLMIGVLTAPRFTAAIPRAQLVPLPGCGHVPMADDPVSSPGRSPASPPPAAPPAKRSCPLRQNGATAASPRSASPAAAARAAGDAGRRQAAGRTAARRGAARRGARSQADRRRDVTRRTSARTRITVKRRPVGG
jgi:hypothetical protein